MEHKHLTGNLFVYPSGMLCVCLHLLAHTHTHTHTQSNRSHYSTDEKLVLSDTQMSHRHNLTQRERFSSTYMACLKGRWQPFNFKLRIQTSHPVANGHTCPHHRRNIYLRLVTHYSKQTSAI